MLGPLGATLGDVVKERLNHGGYNVTRGDGVDTDVELAPFGGEVAGELDDSCFASVVGGADQTLTRESVNG